MEHRNNYNTKSLMRRVSSAISNYSKFQLVFIKLNLVQGGDYIGAVLSRNNAENISRVLYPNDNVSI